MASAPGSSGTANVASTAASQNYRFALIVLTSLFFMWGFLTCLNDILIPHLKSVFELNYTKAMLVQFCFFGAYFVVSYPAGALVKRVGYKAGIVIGLLVAALGCLLFFPAAEWRTYALFLTALFVLASGITILQVSANPYVTILGDPDKSSFRLTLTQAFNSLGTTVAPSIGSVLILGAALAGSEGLSGEALKTHEAQAVQTPYLILASVLALLAIIFVVLKLPKIVDAHEDSGLATKPAWAHRHLVLGAVGIFVYVGAEVAIGSLLVNFMGESAGIDEVTAGKYLTIYWMGAMIGRFIGAAAMLVVPAARILMFNAICAAVLVAVAIVSPGNIAMWALLGVGLFNSVMFPTIFSLALKGLGASTSQGSGILCMAIVGGAIIPLVQGFLADTMGLQPSFFLPILCYVFIAYFGLTGHRSQGE